MTVMAATILAVSLAACGSGSGSLAPSVPTGSPTSGVDTPSPATSPISPSASADPTGLRWVQGDAPGIAADTDPGIDHEVYVFGWSRGYLGFTSASIRATGKMQGVFVTSSTDGLHWRTAGQLGLSQNDSPPVVIVTQVVEGPSGLLATAEDAGCALGKPAVRMWRSTDGVSWSTVDLKSVFGADVVLPAVSGGSAGYIVVAATPDNRRTVWTSQDGASWHERSIPGDGFSPASAASFRGGFVLAGSTRPAPLSCEAGTPGPATGATGSAWSSRLGSPWSEAALPGVLAGDTTMAARRLNDETVLAEEIGLDASAKAPDRRGWTSGDGLTWLRDDALAAPLGNPLTDGTRTMFVGSTDQGTLEVWSLAHDLRLVDLGSGPGSPLATQVSAALGPSGLVVTDGSGATSWLGVPIP
jgi:hypothetical protein